MEKILSGKGAKQGHNFTLTVTESSTSASANTSTLSVRFTIGGEYLMNWTGWGDAIKYVVRIGDTSYNGSIPAYGSGYTANPLVLVNRSLTVPHDEDGSKTLQISFSVTDTSGASYTCGNASNSGIFELTNIPRGTTITIAPNDVITKGQTLSIKGKKSIASSVDTIVGVIGTTEVFRQQVTQTTDYTLEYSYQTIVNNAHLQQNANYLMTITAVSVAGGAEVGRSVHEIKVSTGTMPLSVIYQDGKYGVAFGEKAQQTDKIVSKYSLEIGDASTNLSLLLNGVPVGGGSLDITPNTEQVIGKYNGKDLYLRVIRWSSGAVAAAGTQIGSIGKVDEIVQLNFTMTPSNKANFWTGSVRDGSYYHQGVMVERSTGNVKVFYQDGWGSGTLVTVWVMYTKG